MNIIPAVDVLEGNVVRLARGSYESVTVYGDDPVAQCAAWIDEGATIVHVVDLGGARSGSPDVALWHQMAAAGIPFQVGGGLRSVALVEKAVEAGATRAVIGTAAVWNQDLLGAMVKAVGASQVVVALDVGDGMAKGAGWEDEGRRVDDVVAAATQVGVIRALVTGISRDGMMSGPDLEVLATVRDAAPEMALIASGGVGSLRDLEVLSSSSAEAVIVGRALYERRFTLPEALAALAAAAPPGE